VWERLTSDAPVSGIRQTVREGRDQMRARMLARLPDDLRGARVLDAGCGTGAMTVELAARGASVVAVDLSPQLIAIAEKRLPEIYRDKVTFMAGDMTAAAADRVDYVVAMDSLIYYRSADVVEVLNRLARHTASAIVFTLAPRTPALMAMWSVGRMFPRADRSPTMQPQSAARLRRLVGPSLQRIGRVNRGFYISDLWEMRP
jgi:magnesium-protoporphyrin O-methyltransferase